MTDKFAHLAVDELAQGENVRFALTEIEELAADIRRRGVLQAIVVIPNEAGDGVEVLVGHRRLAAAKLAGLSKIPCVLRPREDAANRLMDQAAENLMRVDLSPVEEAKFCKGLTEHGLSIKQVAAQVHRKESWVHARLHLLTLPQCLQDAVHDGRVGISKAMDVAPQLKDRDAVERLERCLTKAGGLSLFWRETYEIRNRRAERMARLQPQPEPAPERPDDLLRGIVYMERHMWERLDAYVSSLATPMTINAWLVDLVGDILDDVDYENGVTREVLVPP